MTIPANLITLCSTDHDGMDPVDTKRAADLHEKIAILAARQHRTTHALGVQHYRRQVHRALREPRGPFPPPVLSLEWQSMEVEWRLAYAQFCTDSVLRHFDSKEWRRIALSGD